METNHLFRILSLIPDDLVQGYRVEYVVKNDSSTFNLHHTIISPTIPTLTQLFLQFFQPHIEIFSSDVYLKEGGFLEVDTLSGILTIHAEIQFLLVDTLRL